MNLHSQGVRPQSAIGSTDCRSIRWVLAALQAPDEVSPEVCRHNDAKWNLRQDLRSDFKFGGMLGQDSCTKTMRERIFDSPVQPPSWCETAPCHILDPLKFYIHKTTARNATSQTPVLDEWRSLFSNDCSDSISCGSCRFKSCSGSLSFMAFLGWRKFCVVSSSFLQEPSDFAATFTDVLEKGESLVRGNHGFPKDFTWTTHKRGHKGCSPKSTNDKSRNKRNCGISYERVVSCSW